MNMNNGRIKNLKLDFFNMINNMMGSGMGNFFSSNNQSRSQMGFNTNMNNVFSQFGNMANNGFFTNQSSSENQNREENDENENNARENNPSDDEEESEEELQKRYIELRNSVINQLPRFKFNDYKRMNLGKEIHEYILM